MAEQDDEVLALVPDHISIFDLDTGEAMSTELLRCGKRVGILCVRVLEITRTPEALKAVAPDLAGAATRFDAYCIGRMKTDR